MILCDTSVNASPLDGAGLVLMQLAVPRLRSAAALRGFREAMTACNHDLAAWRARERPPPAQTAALGANGGAGWELASSLLRPRRIEVRRVLVIRVMLI